MDRKGRFLRVDPLDLVVLGTLMAVSLSYYLGFSLDWNADAEAVNARYALDVDTPPNDDTPDTAIVAQNPAVEPENTSWDEMVRRLHAEAIVYPGRVGIYLQDLKNKDRHWTYQADELFPAASLIKVPIMISVFQKIHDGGLTLGTKVRLQRRHRTGGSGTLKWKRDGSYFTVRDLLEHMIEESDNTAMRMLIDVMGLGYLQQEFSNIGLKYTEIYPEGLSLQGSRVAYENNTTAREMASLLEKIYKGDVIDKDSSELMLDIMKHLKHKGRLAKTLPVGWEIAHKTGLLRRACHDSAIIFSPQGDYVLTVLTGQNRSYGRAKSFIMNVGRITYNFYRGDQNFYARAGLGSKALRD